MLAGWSFDKLGPSHSQKNKTLVLDQSRIQNFLRTTTHLPTRPTTITDQKYVPFAAWLHCQFCMAIECNS
jgi:hypothetical protein